MAFPSFPWRGGNFILRVRPRSVVLPAEPFGRPASLMLGVLWIAVVWGIVLYLRHMAQAAADQGPDKVRQLFVGKWQPEDRSWTIEFTDDGQFRAYKHEVESASGTWQFVGARTVQVAGTHATIKAVNDNFRLVDVPEFRFEIAVTATTLEVRAADGMLWVGGGWFPPADEDKPLHRVKPNP
jgi:hypothetical protein